MNNRTFLLLLFISIITGFSSCKTNSTNSSEGFPNFHEFQVGGVIFMPTNLLINTEAYTDKK